jgi:hypothetical protein
METLQERARNQLKSVAESFRGVRYVAVLDQISGDIVCTIDEASLFPPEFDAFVLSFVDISHSLMGVFSSGSIKSIKLKGLNNSLFYLYAINDHLLLVFYSLNEDDGSSFVMNFDDANLALQKVLRNLNEILL